MTDKTAPEKPKTLQTLFRTRPAVKPAEESDQETIQWLDEFTERMTRPGQQEEAFFARRRKSKLGVGLDESGNRVRAVEITDE